MITARPATETDVPFILDSFAHELRGSVYVEGLTHGQVRGLMVQLLQTPDWNATILCDDETQDEIIGYCVWKSPTEIAWLQIKGLYRHKGLGMARRLLSLIGATPGRIKATFIPGPDFSRAARSHGWTLHHRPYQGLGLLT